jgi:hypothetical protein
MSSRWANYSGKGEPDHGRSRRRGGMSNDYRNQSGDKND